MAIRDVTKQRLYLDVPLLPGERVALSAMHAHYLGHVLRLGARDTVLVFNGRDGEWLARLVEMGKRGAALEVAEQTRSQEEGPDLHYLFAPLKRTRLDYMVEKAVEMGVARLCPVRTHRTIVDRVNGDRMRANAIEAAEQCGILRLPEILPLETLASLLARWDANRPLVFCDENAPVRDPLAALAKLRPGPVAVLVGPEGGFTPEERLFLLSQAYTLPISLGSRIMRADTAAVAALALVNACLGDWRN